MTCLGEEMRWKEGKRDTVVAHLSYGLFRQSMAAVSFETVILGWTEIVHEDSKRKRMSDNDELEDAAKHYLRLSFDWLCHESCAE
jgi:hypothetical protein